MGGRRSARPCRRGSGREWLLHFHCYAIRFDDGRTVLVDAGIGLADAPGAGWTPVPGRLPEQLARAAIEPSTVDAVVLTHLHTDHIGWAVQGCSRTLATCCNEQTSRHSGRP